MDKKLENKRLFIYLIICFSITWAWFFLFILNGFRWDDKINNKSSVIALGMIAPLISNILTRWITKEGFAMTGKDSLMFGISLKEKKWIYFVLALFLPWFYFELSDALTLIIYPDFFDAQYYKTLGMEKVMLYISPLVAIVSASIVSFAALGEEGGWRGYMMPKLINLVGFKKAVFIGGIIWGIWHAPLTCIGHNFGTDYPGFPYVGILIMCLMCTLMGIILTFITIKTESIWPATVLHAINNGSPGILKFFINPGKTDIIQSNPMVSWIIYLVPIGIIACVMFTLISRQE